MLGAQEDPAVAQLRKQLKEFGFEEQVIKAVLLQESDGRAISLEHAIDLCLGHNDFQVRKQRCPSGVWVRSKDFCRTQ